MINVRVRYDEQTLPASSLDFLGAFVRLSDCHMEGLFYPSTWRLAGKRLDSEIPPDERC